MGSRTEWLINQCVKLLLLLVNLAFFALAVLELYAGTRLRADGWLEVLHDNYPWLDQVYIWSIIGLSAMISLVAFSGCYGAVFQSKYVLWFYGVSVTCGVVGCVLLTAASVLSLILANSWSRTNQLDTVAEQDVELRFNELYCVSEAAYLCTSSSPRAAHWVVNGTEDLRDLFLSPELSTAVKDALQQTGLDNSIVDLCRNSSAPLVDTTAQGESVAALCTWCERISKMKPYVRIVAWTNSKCAPVATSAEFCIEDQWQVGNVASSRIFHPPDVVKESPYEQCRDFFLAQWLRFSKIFTGVSALLLLYMTLVLKFTCHLLISKREYEPSVKERQPLIQRATK